ncbi:hypothetical protein VTN02DRAFT_6400 [Thermoascus thermophilus]
MARGKGTLAARRARCAASSVRELRRRRCSRTAADNAEIQPKRTGRRWAWYPRFPAFISICRREAGVARTMRGRDRDAAPASESAGIVSSFWNVPLTAPLTGSNSPGQRARVRRARQPESRCLSEKKFSFSSTPARLNERRRPPHARTLIYHRHSRCHSRVLLLTLSPPTSRPLFSPLSSPLLLFALVR